MSRPQPRSRDEVFYVGGWTREIERAVLMKLEFEQWSGNWVVGDTGNNKQCLQLVRQDVNAEMGVDIPVDLYFAKLNEWIQQTNRFGGLIERPNFQYDIPTNTVEASDSVWIDIARYCRFICKGMLYFIYNIAFHLATLRDLNITHKQTTASNMSFYVSVWTPAMEARFIAEAIDQADDGVWRKEPCAWRNEAFVNYVCPRMNEHFNLHMTARYYADKLQSLFDRRHFFAFVIGHAEVQWDSATNRITMSAEAFKFLATLCPLAHSYKVRGEPHYATLLMSFPA
ncbi:hypothetical protein C2S52_017332 [Perilla frutescens var. hirtella]|nr:hypothetical protein C2S52_017332 [Perilla frutescens var. hirtella]